MKKLKKLLYIVPLLGLMATACTDIESIEIDHIGGNNTKDDVESEAYYADLRAYKETLPRLSVANPKPPLSFKPLVIASLSLILYVNT